MHRRHLLMIALATTTLPLSLLANATQRVLAARGWNSDDKLRIVLDLTGAVQYQCYELAAPARLIVDLENARLAAALNDKSLITEPVTAIRSSQESNGTTRVVFEFSQPVASSSFLLGPSGDKGHRLVLDFKRSVPVIAKSETKDVSPPQPAEPVSARPNKAGRDIVLVIDAGHGGKDPGAVGANGEKEKLVALSIAQLLAAKMNRKKGFKARLVRNDDIFIPLRKRVDVARKYNADMFVSVHADAAPRRTASGASVFALSEHGATSTMARFMADRENNADNAGSRQLLVLKDKDPMIAQVVLDMSMTSTIGSSLDLGKRVLNQVGAVAGVHGKRVEQAGFAVLKSPDIPSILVETGFISNPGDCKRLVDARHQEKLAEAMAVGIEAYFSGNPPMGWDV